MQNTHITSPSADMLRLEVQGMVRLEVQSESLSTGACSSSSWTYLKKI